MNRYSEESERKLSTCDPDLQRVFRKVLEIRDHTIVFGHRGEVEQNGCFAAGTSDKRWPESEHNSIPSRAIDARPYPYDEKDYEAMCLFAGIVIAVGYMMGVKIRWGGDWNTNYRTRDERFRDYWHFEKEA